MLSGDAIAAVLTGNEPMIWRPNMTRMGKKQTAFMLWLCEAEDGSRSMKEAWDWHWNQSGFSGYSRANVKRWVQFNGAGMYTLFESLKRRMLIRISEDEKQPGRYRVHPLVSFRSAEITGDYGYSNRQWSFSDLLGELLDGERDELTITVRENK
jgi:hypothetical protein